MIDVADVDLAVSVDGDADPARELALAPFALEGAAGAEANHAAIAGIGDVDPSRTVDGDAARTVEAERPFVDERTGGGEFLDAVVPGVGHVHRAVRADGDAARIVELTRHV